ncbi:MULTISPECIES: serine--tRNA ligase [unclassified Mesorhizobium]|uniref:serine--tRNA ligase n=1 Tax=unclassified Mesorhizobium TaxID=325217 RepID=UPI0003CE2EA0|nr:MULTISPECIES: serine--tRNA ligase [unclassified Mesorhizobium]ESX15986.1 seryl-tRNA synthetase [Mesorhizobium sp. LSJC255A00]ESX29858.1 seryl-tRNA synthetase [Mesorhizobium sp. LSHC440B00]ESX35216.1 seryl-tRNA synthetase [Mesorhizobium sp. LSHC432A00]ESX41431.1 seryl-tRNA synthetase [Mesorhizobium sp. LSHC440A00]ESX50187.1 seryl-tRNA synthetase [Mesorhizobium sp. LSHC426A00]
MLDIKWIRDNPKALVEALAKRSWSADEAQSTVDELIKKDEARREHVTELQTKQERRNAASKEIGNAMRSGDTALAEKLKAEVGDIKTFIQNGEARERELDKTLNDALAVLPNVPLDDVPVGKDEHDNVVKHIVGEVPTRPNWVKEHFEIGEALGMMDFERAAKLSGSRFTVLKSGLARMERAIGQFMLDLHTTEHGYEEVIPPLMVRDEVLFGTNQLPKFEDDLFFVQHGDGRLGLIPTAEVPLTNLVREEITAHEKLPLRYTALTPCFRSEAGSAGRDTRGMLRQHQFYKVELVSVTDQESSLAEHERMTQCAEEVLKRLELPFRTMVLCTGDMGFGARKTYDIEVWLPGQNAYREISSCSVCGDFQARRMDARYKDRDGNGNRFVHTLNGSGTAVGRALIAVIENYQNEDGSVTIPEVLRPYMGGLAKIESK